jgi:hypothetical protein
MLDKINELIRQKLVLGIVGFAYHDSGMPDMMCLTIFYRTNENQYSSVMDCLEEDCLKVNWYSITNSLIDDIHRQMANEVEGN